MAPSGRARWRISASSAEAVLTVANGARPARREEAGRPEKPGDISWQPEHPIAACDRASSDLRRPARSPWCRNSPSTSAPAVDQTAGLSPAPLRSAAIAVAARASWQRPHRGEAAKRQRVLHPPRTFRLEEIAALDERQHQSRGLGLSGRGPQRDHPRIDRREVGAGRLERQRSGRGLRLRHQPGVMQRERACADAVGIGVQERDRILGTEDGASIPAG